MHSAFGTIAISSSPAIVSQQSPALASTPRPERISHNTRSFTTVYSDLMTELYNEPTQGLYFVNQHLETMGPRLIKIKYDLDGIRQKLSTALTDVTEDIDAVDKILKSQCNLDGKSDVVQKLRHDYGHAMKKKRSSSKEVIKIENKQNQQIEQKNNNEQKDNNLDNKNHNDNMEDMNEEDDNDFGFGEFLQISVMLSQCRSLMEFAKSMDAQ
eukprot:46922_1